MPPAAGSSSTPAQATEWQIKAFTLQYFDKKTKQWAEYTPNSREFILVADAYRFALNLFRRDDAIATRLKLGNGCVKVWKDPALASQYGNFTWSGNEAQMAQYERQYMEAVHNRPPGVYVHDLKDAFASTVREVNAKRQLQGSFNPRDMFRFKLNREVLDALLANDKDLFRPRNIQGGEDEKIYNAFVKKQATEYHALRFLLAVTFFHELHHGFVAYLAGDNITFTPLSMSYMPDADDTGRGLGESGSFGERNVLGGIVSLDPFPSATKVGNLVMFTEEKFYMISDSSIKSIKLDPRTPKLKASLKSLGGKPYPPASRPSSSSSSSSASSLSIGHASRNAVSAKYSKVYCKHGSQMAPSTAQDAAADAVLKRFPKYNVNLEFEGAQLRPKLLVAAKVR